MPVSNRDSLVAPLPTFLVWRFTDGVYYEICQEPEFGSAFGDSFQRHVGEVVRRANTRGTLQVYPEEEYLVGNMRKDSVDWIVTDDTAAIFVECKTKRLKLEAKVEIRSSEALEDELDKLATFITQVYKTILDCQKGYYRTFTLSSGLSVFPVVLTLEEWYALGI